MTLLSRIRQAFARPKADQERRLAIHIPAPGELVEWFDLESGGTAYASKDLIGDKLAMSQSGESTEIEGVDDLLCFYETALYIYRAVYAIASNLATVPMVATLRQPDGTVEDQPDSELQALLDNPAEGMTQPEFIEAAISFLVLAGSEPLFIERMTRGGMPVPETDPKGLIRWFRPLRPTRISIKTPKGATQVAYSIMGVYRYCHDINGSELLIHPGNIALLRQFNPNSDYWGFSASKVVQRSIVADDTLMNLNVTQLGRGGVPDVALETPDKFDMANARRMKKAWEQRYTPGQSGGVVILSNGLKAKPLGFSNKDMEWQQFADRVQRRIGGALGVPPLYYMDLRDASVLANSATQKEVFFDGTLMPHGGRLVACLTRAIKTDERWASEPWGIRFAWDQVEILTDSRLRKRDQARDAYQATGITKNEYRKELGFGPTEDGDEFFTPAQPSFAFGGDSAPKAIKVRPQATEEFKAVAASAHRASFKSSATDMRSVMREFFADQAARVISAVEEHFNLKGAKGHRSGDFADESLLVSIFPQSEENDHIREDVGPLFLSTVLDSANDRQLSLFPDQNLDAITESNVQVSTFMSGWSATEITKVNDETRLSIRDTLVLSFQEGWTPSRLIDELGKQFDGWADEPATGTTSRAERVARTETNMALNSGSHAAALDAEEHGAQLLKQWLSSRDGLVRDSHFRQDALTTHSPIPLRQSYDNGLQYPSDPSGSASETVNCRCSQIEIVNQEPTP